VPHSGRNLRDNLSAAQIDHFRRTHGFLIDRGPNREGSLGNERMLLMIRKLNIIGVVSCWHLLYNKERILAPLFRNEIHIFRQGVPAIFGIVYWIGEALFVYGEALLVPIVLATHSDRLMHRVFYHL
jgi:hypothetical protein